MNYLELANQAVPVMLNGVTYTVLFAVASMLGGLVLGFALAVARIVPVALSRTLASAFVSFIRGTPLLVQIFVLYYGLPGIGIEFSPVTAGILALSLNAGAYLCESIRGAILSIGSGQWDASYSLGMNYSQTLRYVIVPQAIRTAVPSMSNTLISLIKDTSLVSVITVTELMLATKEVISTTFRPLPLYIMAAFAYWSLSLCLELVQITLERRLNHVQR